MRNPPLIGPSAVATPAIAAQRPIALPRSSGGNVLVMIDSVAGMMNAPPMPISATRQDELVRCVDERAREGAESEHRHAELQRAAPPEPVTQAPGREQQAREHERVGVDDPLELAVARVEVVARASGSRR